MRELLVAVRDLCVFRIGPQDLPCSTTLLAIVILCNVGLDSGTGYLMGQPGLALVASLVSLAVVLGGIRLYLGMRHLQARFVQTALATVSAALVFGILASPIQVTLKPLPQDPEQITGNQMLAMLVLLVIGCWALAVMAHILRHALERSFLAALLLALALNFGALAVVSLVIPVPAA